MDERSTAAAACIRGLYALADAEASGGAPVALARAALAGGCRLLQLRCKGWSPQRVRAAADAVQALCEEAGAALIVNDDPALAAAVGAAGVHLGQTDGPLAAARAAVGPAALVGRSTHTPDQARAAVAEGADYVAFGPVFPTPHLSRPEEVRGLAALASVRQLVHQVPLVAIGGITAGNLWSVHAAGADAWAVIGAIAHAEDPERATAGAAGAAGVTTPEQLFALLRDRPHAAWLDGGHTGWSIVAWDPSDVVTDGRGWPESGRALGRTRAPGEVPFPSGVLGYVGYGAGARTAPVPDGPPSPEPEVWLARYDGAACFRHADATWHLTGPASRIRDTRALLARAAPLPAPAPPPPRPQVRTVERALYEAQVRQIVDWIAAGDCYQVNLTRPVHVDCAGDPWDAYRRIRAASPARFGAYLSLPGRLAVLSNSPELLLEARGGAVASEPIKGTRPRGATADEDAALAAALWHSAKDRAELAMIVDLVRNDLGRVALVGTVHAEPRMRTSHANVHHTGQRVTCTLAEGRDSWDALAASFPPGSVTGAPKIRACTRIAELESEPRGVYCGAIGFAGDGGVARWSVAIRTGVWSGASARYHVGGGIVADSIPAAEWGETEDKGSVWASALGAQKM